jgi:uncharacterized membrane protein
MTLGQKWRLPVIVAMLPVPSPQPVLLELGGHLFGMPAEKAGSRLVVVILAAVVLLVLLGVLIYFIWREQNSQPKAVPQRAAKQGSGSLWSSSNSPCLQWALAQRFKAKSARVTHH